MSRSVRISLLAGGLIAIGAFLLVDHGGHLGTQVLASAILGIALGAALAMIPHGTLGWRAAAFVWGMVLAWGGYALRAGFLPDIPLGRAIAAALVIVLVTGGTALSIGRMPLWAGLAGVAALSGAYETTFNADPTAFKTDSVTALTAVALSAAIGFVLASASAIPMPGTKPKVAVQPAHNGHQQPQTIVLPEARRPSAPAGGIGVATRRERTS